LVNTKKGAAWWDANNAEVRATKSVLRTDETLSQATRDALEARLSAAQVAYDKAVADMDAAAKRFETVIKGRSQKAIAEAQAAARDALDKRGAAEMELENAQWAKDASMFRVDLQALDSAKTYDEVIAWANDAFPHLKLGFESVTDDEIDKLKAVLQTYGKLAEQYPDIAASVRIIGLNDEPALRDYAEHYIFRINYAAKVYHLDILGDERAFGDGIMLDVDAFRAAAARTPDIMVGAGGDEAKYLSALITHEFGHVVQDFLDNLPSLAERKKVYALEATMRKALNAGDLVSHYAGGNLSEMFAESFAAIQQGTTAERDVAYVRELQTLLNDLPEVRAAVERQLQALGGQVERLTLKSGKLNDLDTLAGARAEVRNAQRALRAAEDAVRADYSRNPQGLLSSALANDRRVLDAQARLEAAQARVRRFRQAPRRTRNVPPTLM
jgi:hypothetical protein